MTNGQLSSYFPAKETLDGGVFFVSTFMNYNYAQLSNPEWGLPINNLGLTRSYMSNDTEIAEKDDDIDGCDCNFNEADATPDEDLPAAHGGVE